MKYRGILWYAVITLWLLNHHAFSQERSRNMGMIISSPAFPNQGEIPSKYTCDGENVSPPLEWSGVPEGARSLVLIVDDPDAPDPKAPKMVWVTGCCTISRLTARDWLKMQQPVPSPLEPRKASTTGKKLDMAGPVHPSDDIGIFSSCMRWIRSFLI